ncbi:MAG TPA: response regulator [Candidatus Kryptonia bacterium]|nr:response regulator [Candidatus Kryptonia bacterium]
MDEKARILGVDDSLTIRKALEIVLKPAGYDLDLAADGAEAVAKAKAFKPAVILLDFILPDMRGTEVCRLLAEDPETAQIPIVLISAKGAEIRQAYRDAGNVVSYIAKPFKPQIVTGIVAEVLAKTAAGELGKSAVSVHEGIGVPPLPEIEAPPSAGLPDVSAETPRSIPAFTATDGRGAIDGDAHTAEVGGPANGHDALEAGEIEELGDLPVVDTRLSTAARREMLEMMFETLRAGLEGVYVEEVDTPEGAAADQATSYTGLIERLGRELDETLHHARSGARFTLYGDGSIRSLDETLLDVFRRSCRLLFRAVVAGAVENEAAPQRARILAVCNRDSRMLDQLRSLGAAHPEWQVFTISEGFRQLPMMTRLYGPTHVIAEVTGGGALWDQLRVLQRLPETRSMTIVGVGEIDRRNGHGDPAARTAALAERGITRVLNSVFEFETEPGRPTTDDAAAVPPVTEFDQAQPVG